MKGGKSRLLWCLRWMLCLKARTYTSKLISIFNFYPRYFFNHNVYAWKIGKSTTENKGFLIYYLLWNIRKYQWKTIIVVPRHWLIVHSGYLRNDFKIFFVTWNLRILAHTHIQNLDNFKLLSDFTQKVKQIPDEIIMIHLFPESTWDKWLHNRLCGRD